MGIIILGSCRLHRELHKPENKDKILLNKTTIDLIKNNKSSGDEVSDYSVGEYIKQKPNRKLLFNRWMPYTGIYLRAEDHFKKETYKNRKKKDLKKVEKRFSKKIEKAGDDSLKVDKLIIRKTKKIQKIEVKLNEGNSLMQSINQAPVWLNDSITELSKDQIQLYLEANGFFQSRIEIEKQFKRNGRAVNLNYKVIENEPHVIQNINYDIEDKNISELVILSIENSTLKKGANYNVQNISDERERIYDLLKNQGYFDFQRQYINFKVDTTMKPFAAYIDIIVQNPSGKPHTQYTIEKINVMIDIDGSFLGDTIFFENINFFHDSIEKYSKKVLREEIAFDVGEPYSQDKSRFTKNNLSNLEIIKFVNINYAKSDSSKLSAFISVKTHKKFQITSELGANLNVNQGQSIPGPYIDFRAKNRKLFRGFESLEFNTNYFIQGQVSILQPDSIYRRRQFSGGLSLVFPRLIVPNYIKDSEILKRKNPFQNNIYKQTRLNVGYTDVNRHEFRRSNFNLSFKYEWRKGANERFYFNPLEINIVNTPYITSEYKEYLNTLSQRNGINIKQSFEPSIITNLTFGYMWNDIDVTKNQKATMVKLGGELGGLLTELYDKLTNNNGQILQLPFYKYYKITADVRKYYPLSKFSNFVFRIAGGYEQTILNSTVLPYEKYFFTGGVSSNRAWQARLLGPGNYNPDIALSNNIVFERPGEILFEANLEYRTKISGIFNTAFFIDASNVWSNISEDNRPNSQFDIFNIHRSLGIGAGTGLRLDFSLLIARFDFAWRVYDPALQSFVKFKLTDSLFNFGIGYPF